MNILPKKPLRLRPFILPMLLVAIAVSILVVVTSEKIQKQQQKVPKPTGQKTDQQTANSGEYTRLSLPQREPPFFTLAGETKSRFGILPREVFVLKTREKVSQTFVQSVLESNVPVSVKASGEAEFILTPSEELSKDEVFTIKLAVKNETYERHTFDRNYSWSFQTQGKFLVVSTIPGNNKTDVPINTGIEFVFSQDDYKDPTNYISITPSVDFRIERHEETLAVVPQKPLAYETVYTVTLKKGLNLTSRSDLIMEDVVFSFQTAEEKAPEGYLSLSADLIEYAPPEAPAVKVYSERVASVQAKVYRFSDSSAFVASREQIDKARSSWYHYYSEKSAVDTSSLQTVDTYELPIEKEQAEPFPYEVIRLPTPLPPGYYYTRFEYGAKKRFAEIWLQVTDLAGFVSAGTKTTVVWANTLSNAQPVAGAIVSVFGVNTPFFTDERGYVVFHTPSALLKGTAPYIYIKKDDKEILLPVSAGRNEKSETAQDYWAYLYNERNFYKPDDAVNFWGIVKHRDTSAVPQAVTVEITKGGSYYDEGNSAAPVISRGTSVVPNASGTFAGSLPFTNLTPGYYSLNLRSGDLVLASSYITVLNYVKPDMKIEVLGEKKAIFSDQTVGFTAQVRFFDETPVSHMNLLVKQSRHGETTDEIKTNSSGRASYTYAPSGEVSYHGDYRRTECIVVTPKTTTESTIEGDACVEVFYRKLLMTSSSKSEGNRGLLRLRLNHVDIDKYNSDPQNGFTGAPAPKQPVEVTIVKKWSERVERGTTYDYIEKVTRPNYDYVQKQEQVLKQTFQTGDNGNIAYDFNLEKDRSYEAVMMTADKDGRKIEEKAYFYYYQYQTVREDAPSTAITLDLSGKETNLFTKDEQVNVVIRSGTSAYPDTDTNRFLFLVSSRGRQEAYLENTPTRSFSFEEKHIPNAAVSAIVFTGKTYIYAQTSCKSGWSCSWDYYWHEQGYSLPALQLVYDKKQSELSLSVSYDKASYGPADEANVTVTVTDKNTTPVSGAEVNIALVDQALAAIGGAREPSTLTSLYPTVSSGMVYSYYSHKPIVPEGGGAERGGGGDGDERELFKDTAFFGRGQTDSNGTVRFTFTLPDNITTWNVYTQAVTGDLQAGQTISSIATTKDFFVYPAFISTFLATDKPALSGSAFGTGLTESDPISFTTIFSKNDTEIDTKTHNGSAFRSYEFPFPSLSEGEYKLSLEGKFKEKRDKVTLPFTVIDSRFALTRYLEKTLAAGDSLSAPQTTDILSSKPYRLVVADQGKGTYYADFLRYCSLSSNRLEKMLSKQVAGTILKEQFEDDDCVLPAKTLAAYQGSDGGLGQVVWGASNLETTVWAITFSTKPFDTKRLSSYLEGQFRASNAGTVQKTLAAWGLTKLGTPKLLYLQQLGEQAGTFEEKITAALALADNGETERARELYYDLLANYGYENDPYIRIESDANTEKNIDKLVEDSSRALLLGALVEPTYNHGLFTYLRDYEYETDDVVLDLAQMAFMKDQLAKAPDVFTKLTYTSASRSLSKEMKTGGTWAITVDPSERDTFTLRVDEGKAEAMIYYTVGIGGLSAVPKDDRLKLVRSYTNLTGQEGYHPGDIVEIVLDFEFDQVKGPRGEYTVTDVLPSGFVFLSNPSLYGYRTDDWAYEPEKNVIRFSVYNNPWWLQYHDTRLVYYARVAGAGTYVAEPTVFHFREKPSIMMYTEAETITISGASQ